MFEQLGNGFLGLFLVLGQWISPAGRPDLSVEAARTTVRGYFVQCQMSIGWNDEMEALVDAGIPLRFRIGAYCDGCDSVVFERTLRCDVAQFTYAFADTFTAGRDSAFASKTYPQVLIALRDFTRWSFEVPLRSLSCRVEAELLPSRAARLNRTVDMSVIWGQKKITKVVMLEQSRRERRAGGR